MQKIIDLRSDTVTKPDEGMRKVMYDAEVGDDVYKEDPTANKLEEYVAELFGKEAGLFVPSGLMGNQICLNLLTNPSDEVICDYGAHIFQYESGSPAALSGIMLNTIQTSNGVFTADKVEPLIRPESAYYMPRTKAIAIENTHNRAGGTVYPIDEIQKLRVLANKYSLSFHLDGARIWNAHTATGIPLDEYGKYFDTMSVCLSKGLGAPVGSVILGTKEMMKEAFRVRKAWGGGMRQIGILAAAGMYAIKNNLPKLNEDHQKAKMIAESLESIGTVECNSKSVQSNILTFSPKKLTVEDVIAKCREKGLLVSTVAVGVIRIVTHIDVSIEETTKAIEILKEVLK